MAMPSSTTIPDHRHERDTAAGDANHWSVELGTHLTGTVPSISMMDADLTTNASGLPNYAPCVSCHNPHGSTNTDTKGSGGGANEPAVITGDSDGAVVEAGGANNAIPGIPTDSGDLDGV